MPRNKQRRNPEKTGRVSHRFELNIRRSHEADLDEAILKLVADRKFAATIRNALRLVISLNAGDTSVLNELYPEVVNNLAVGQGNNPPEPPPDIKALNDRVEQLTQIVLQNSVGSVMSSTYQPAITAAPVAVVQQAKAASAEDIADNFLSMFQ